jgi:hypothetical protein
MFVYPTLKLLGSCTRPVRISNKSEVNLIRRIRREFQECFKDCLFIVYVALNTLKSSNRNFLYSQHVPCSATIMSTLFFYVVIKKNTTSVFNGDSIFL